MASDCKKSVTRECDWTQRGDYDRVVELAVKDLRDKLLQRVRNRLMNGGSDLGGRGVFDFDEKFYEGVRVQITVSSRVSLERFIQSLSKPTTAQPESEWQQPGTYKQIRKGDSVLFMRDIGELVSEPEYRSDERSGLFYADVVWTHENGTSERVNNFMICRVGLKWKPAPRVHQILPSSGRERGEGFS
jgi:hypothetical protein